MSDELVYTGPKNNNQENPWAAGLDEIAKHTFLLGRMVALLEQQKNLPDTDTKQVTSTNYLNDLIFDFNVMVLYIDNTNNSNDFTIKKGAGVSWSVLAGSQGYAYVLGGRAFQVQDAPTGSVFVQAIDTLITGM